MPNTTSTFTSDFLKTLLADSGFPLIPAADCNRTEFVGNGSSFQVYTGTCNINGEIHNVAFKEPIRRRNQKQTIAKAIIEEVKLGARLRGTSEVISLLGVTMTEDTQPVLVMELAESDLVSYLVEKKENGTPVDWVTKAQFVTQIAQGLRKLHSSTIGVVHGDIKGENILIVRDRQNPKKLFAKISDFGYSSTVSSIEFRKGVTGGTPRFAAPECTRAGQFSTPELIRWEQQYTKDVYAYGLVVWQICTDGEIPYDSLDYDTMELKKLDKLPTYLLDRLPDDTPDEFRILIAACAQYHPLSRLNLSRVQTLFATFFRRAEYGSLTTHLYTALVAIPHFRTVITILESPHFALFASQNEPARALIQLFFDRILHSLEDDVISEYRLFTPEGYDCSAAHLLNGLLYRYSLVLSPIDAHQSPSTLIHISSSSLSPALQTLLRSLLSAYAELGSLNSPNKTYQSMVGMAAIGALGSLAAYELGQCYLYGWGGLSQDRLRAASLFRLTLASNSITLPLNCPDPVFKLSILDIYRHSQKMLEECTTFEVGNDKVGAHTTDNIGAEEGWLQKWWRGSSSIVTKEAGGWEAWEKMNWEAMKKEIGVETTGLVI